MNKKKIRCYFTDFWNGFDLQRHLGYLYSEYDIIIDKDHPDYLFYSCFGNQHLLYDNCIKIYWSAENVVPDLNICDYAVCLSDIQCSDRIIHHYSSLYFRGRDAFRYSLQQEELLNRKFCNFVYSNNKLSDPIREQIFTVLSKYKPIDSGGCFLNNMGVRVKDKLSFLRDYKFTLAIENSSVAGYVTEKIYDPFLSQSLPVYWGDPNISSAYQPNSFVNIMSYSSLEEAVEEIIRLDNDDAAYLDKVTTPFWPYGDSFEEFYDIEVKRMLSFFRNIFEQPLEKACRRTRYGRANVYYSNMKRINSSPEQLMKEKYVNSLKGIVKKMIRK